MKGLHVLIPAALVLFSCRAPVAENACDLAEKIYNNEYFSFVKVKALEIVQTGFNAGDAYGEVWIRDYNTFIELAAQVYSPDVLKENLMVFLRLQGNDGNIVDGFIPKELTTQGGYEYIYSELEPRYAGHKNTVETDQESSLIQAFYKYISVTGDSAVLKEEIGDKAVAERLERAMEFLLHHRYSEEFGLLYGATTADWGDVQPEHDWGVYLTDDTHFAIDVYDNAMFLIALDQFMELVPGKREQWQPVHDDIAAGIRRHLWDGNHRKFIPHVYLDGSPFPPDFDENTVFYHGGTAVAIEAGLLSNEEIGLSLQKMVENVKASGAASIGLTLYPPYPEGFFKARGMEPYGYQNGGDWTWFGGRMILQLIKNGFVEEAYREIQPMVERVKENNGFYEWYSVNNEPRGSGTFRGSAGVLFSAIEMFEKWAEEACRGNHRATFSGFPDRSADLDVLPGFKDPPAGYGMVPFYWWVGDTLTRERISWQLDQLENMGITGLQVNYCHTDSGGASYGLTYPGQPALFSDEWWSLFGWFLKEAKKRDMSVSLSDYTLGAAGQGWYIDEMLAEDPALHGSKLEARVLDMRGGETLEMPVPGNLISAVAYPVDEGCIEGLVRVDIKPDAERSLLSWEVPAGDWKVFLIHRNIVKTSFDPMHPLSGPKVIEKFFQRFEDHFPGESGKGLNFFFSDELTIGVQGFLWNDFFAASFLDRKGYDVVPRLPHLFADINSTSCKIRLDYTDVMVALSEEGFFKPVYEWHTDRGMLFGCDHGGRGQDVTEFGDYFRTQRWMTGPGNDQPGLGRNIIKNKVASSIAHMYERPRTWLEGFYGSGWGTSSEELADAIFANYAMGHNLLSLHGLYYTTRGSWWEWAAPDNHFRQPYWAHAKGLVDCIERLSYLLSQGHHVCDVAMIYPVAPAQAGLKGKEAVQTAFDIARDIYSSGIDFDFMDFQSLDRCLIRNRELHVSGEKYRVLILPAMAAVRYSTLEKALDFYRSGGTVICAGSLPEASDRIGADDEQLRRMTREMFGTDHSDSHDPGQVYTRTNQAHGKAIFVPDPGEVSNVIAELFQPDFQVIQGSGTPYVLHRKAGNRDIYFIYGLTKGTRCFFRCSGKVELWDPWEGTVSSLPVLSVNGQGTVLLLPLDENQPQLIVFSPGDAEILAMPAEKAERHKEVYRIDGAWEFELKPVLDNVYGDYRLPAFKGKIGPETWSMKFMTERDPSGDWHQPHFNDSDWQRVDVSFGQKCWKLGPLPALQNDADLEAKIAGLTGIEPSEPLLINGKEYHWQPYEFSWRWGLKDDAGHQGYHGMKGNVNNDIFTFGKIDRTQRYMPVYPLNQEPEGTVYYLFSTLMSSAGRTVNVLSGGLLPAGMWLNGKRHDPGVKRADLKTGANPVLIKYEDTGRGYVVFTRDEENPSFEKPVSLATDWYLNPLVVPYRCSPDLQRHFGRYRFSFPPGTEAARIVSVTKPEVWAGGKICKVKKATPGEGRIAEKGFSTWKAILPEEHSYTGTMAVRLEQFRGLTGGDAIPEPVVFECGRGKIELGNLKENDALKSYSGGMWYRRSIHLTRAQAMAGEVILDLGVVVASAEVRVNGKPAGTALMPPWEFDLTGKLEPGENRVEILVYNTLGNHFLTTPSQYVGRTDSGLIGPVTLKIHHHTRADNSIVYSFIR